VPTLKLTQQHFFEHYNDLEPGKWVKLIGWGDVAEANQLIRDAIRRERDEHADLPL
jgi:inorganic pyrophosphatase